MNTVDLFPDQASNPHPIRKADVIAAKLTVALGTVFSRERYYPVVLGRPDALNASVQEDLGHSPGMVLLKS